MRIYENEFIANSYEQILSDLLYDPDFKVTPRGLRNNEILNCSIVTDNPNFNMFINERRSSVKKYISAEILWYFSGTNDISFISKYASMWKSLAIDNKANSAYGNLIFNEKNEHGFTQYQWALQCLINDKDSRQAFMHFNKPSHQYFDNKDQVCTLVALFHIRDNKLYMTLTMRSNDSILGFMTDFTFFNILHQQMYVHLKLYYPELNMGSYTHISHSMHLYSQHFNLVEEMISTPFYADETPELYNSIIDKNGKYLDKYVEIFEAVKTNNTIPDIITDNELLNWCIRNIKM